MRYDKQFVFNCLTKFVVNHKLDPATHHIARYYKSITHPEKSLVFDRAFTYFQGRTVLDIGCYWGFYSCLMSYYAEKVVGVDVDRSGLVLAKYLKSAMLRDNVIFKQLNVHALTKEFLLQYNITAIFLHKVTGHVSWTDKSRAAFWYLIKDNVDVIVTNVASRDSKKIKDDNVRPVFKNDKRFTMEEIDKNLMVFRRHCDG